MEEEGWEIHGGEEKGGVEGGVARKNRYPIIKHLIKSPGSWKWLWEKAVNLETKRPASGGGVGRGPREGI